MQIHNTIIRTVYASCTEWRIWPPVRNTRIVVTHLRPCSLDTTSFGVMQLRREFTEGKEMAGESWSESSTRMGVRAGYGDPRGAWPNEEVSTFESTLAAVRRRSEFRRKSGE